MTEETLESRLSAIEPKMELAGGLYDVLKNLDKSPSTGEKAALYSKATNLAARGNDDVELSLNEEYKTLNDAYAYTGINQTTGYAFAELEEDYNANKSSIVDYIEQELNKNLEGSENKADAAGKIKYALGPLMDADVSQEEADKMVRDRFRTVTGMAPYFGSSLTGDPERIKDMRYRAIVADFIDEKEEGKKKEYTINREKLAGLVDTIQLGTRLYLNTKQGPPS